MINNEFIIIEDFLSKEECNFILNKCKEELTLSTARVANGNENERKSSVAWINDLGFVNEKLKNVLKINYQFAGIEVTGLGPFQFTEYKVGGYFAWHKDRDSSTYTYRNRFASTVIQLNDDYSGGILEIKDTKGDLIPMNHRMGNLYIFNSNLYHRVTPVEDGIRYTLVNWVSTVKNDETKQNII
jgi:PKHD-type hydroxylase